MSINFPAQTSALPRRIVRNFNLYLAPEGASMDLLGQCSKVKLKVPKKKIEEVRNAGMHYPMQVEMGFEKPECNFTVTGLLPELIAAYGIEPGRDFPFLVAAASVDEGTGRTYSFTISGFGFLTEQDMDDFEAGAKKHETKYELACRSFKLSEDGREIFAADPYQIRVNGRDTTAAINRALLRA
jgi:P2 family phage contractile tail tube protein